VKPKNCFTAARAVGTALLQIASGEQVSRSGGERELGSDIKEPINEPDLSEDVALC
jgi:hypothetical protein